MSWKSLTSAALIASIAEDASLMSLAEAAAHLTARDIIIAEYGEPGAAYQRKYCEVWNVKKDFPWFPADKMLINKDFKKVLGVAFRKLQERGQHTEIKTFDGCYNHRLSVGLKVLSLHAWALAIDMNAKENPLKGAVRWSAGFLQTMRECGIYCGADWKRKDGMHFAMFNG
ncbi:M15 family metallopeptidase [Ferruginibacter yonginensis]|uniref:M15 family metallopeptidase n=1 Tax=Ferruginibacter yonginensis TaxID=1310416 RepID=A0ABV8QSM9_9BACT